MDRLVDKDIHGAFLRCWLSLKRYPDFQSAEQKASADPDAHSKLKDQILNKLIESQNLSLRNIGHEFPLAWLMALDEYLHLRYGAGAPSPAAKVRSDGKSYYIHRRRLSNHLESVHFRQAGHLKSWMRYHWIFPDEIHGITINVAPSPSALVSFFQQDGNELRIFIHHFEDEVCPEWIESDPVKKRAEKLTDPERRWQSTVRMDLLDTPIGLVAIPICRDFCDEGETFNRLWDELGIEWILVPAFGEKTSISAHERRAKAVLRAQGTVSAVANQHPKGTDADQGFICHAGGGNKNGGPPFAGCRSVEFRMNLEK
jgi:hypothetical protein